MVLFKVHQFHTLWLKCYAYKLRYAYGPYKLLTFPWDIKVKIFGTWYANDTANKWKNLHIWMIYTFHKILKFHKWKSFFDRYWFMHDILFKIATSFDFGICRNARARACVTIHFDKYCYMPSLNLFRSFACLSNIATDLTLFWLEMISHYNLSVEYVLLGLYKRIDILRVSNCHIWKSINECSTLPFNTAKMAGWKLNQSTVVVVDCFTLSECNYFTHF